MSKKMRIILISTLAVLAVAYLSFGIWILTKDKKPKDKNVKKTPQNPIVSVADVPNVMLDDMYFEPNENGDGYVLTVCYAADEDDRVVIPETVEGLPVTGIGEDAFQYCHYVKDIIVPKTVTEMSKASFTGTEWYEQKEQDEEFVIVNHVLLSARPHSEVVQIPEGVTAIGPKAFWMYSGITELELPSSLERIEEMSFSLCTGLTSVRIPDSVEYIGVYAFTGCTGLTSIAFPDSLTSIGRDAFSKTGWLEEQKRENEYVIVNHILIAAQECEHAVIPEGVTSIVSAFCDMDSLKAVDLPSSITEIGDCAFSGCSNFERITIPSSVTRIGYTAFVNCSSLKSITIPDSVTEIDSYAFEDCTSLESIEIPDSVSKIGFGTFVSCSKLKSVEIPNSVTEIDSYAFSGCKSLESIEIPSSVTKMGAEAFEYCDNLKSVKRNGSVMNIESGEDFPYEQFDNRQMENGLCIDENGILVKADKDIVSAVIPEGVKVIGESAFSDCKELQEVSIPEGVKVIENTAFEYCEKLSVVTLPQSLRAIGESVFYNNFSLEEITLPDNIRHIGDYAFQYCHNLKDITIPLPECEVGTFALSGTEWIRKQLLEEDYVIVNGVLLEANRNVTNAVIPKSVTRIGGGAFYGCDLLESVTIPDSVTEIGRGAFSGCSLLKSVPLSDSVTKIGENAFYGCSELKEISLPKSLTQIEKWAFQNCSSLKEISIPEGLIEFNALFSGCDSLTEIYIPESMMLLNFRDIVSLRNIKTVRLPERFRQEIYDIYQSDYPEIEWIFY